MANICFVTPEYIPLVGGTGSYVYYLSENLARYGNSVYVVTKNNLGKNGRATVLSVKTFRISPLDNFFFYIRSSQKIMQINEKVPVDIVHVNLPLVPSFAVPRNLGKALVATVHTTWMGEKKALRHEPFLEMNISEKIVVSFNPILRFLEHALLERSDIIIAVSEHTKRELLEKYHLNADKVTVIHNGVDVEKFKPAEDKNKVKRALGFGDNRVVLYVGRLYSRKGLPTLLKAASIVLRRTKNVKFVISGKSFHKEEEKLRALVEKLKLQKDVLFAGYTPDEKLPQLYQASDVFVLPSTYEGLPFTLLEALASGLPAVATNVGGVPEVIADGKNGFLVSPLDFQDLAEKILYLLENPSFAFEMGRLGRKTVEEKFTWQNVTRQVLEIYNKVLTKRGF